MVGTYQFAQRHPGNLGALACAACQYQPKGHPALRGLGDDVGYIPAGSTFNYQARFYPSSTSINPLSKTFGGDPAQTISAVQQNLTTQWGIIVVGSSYNANLSDFSYTVTLQLQTMKDYGAIRDIQSVVDGAFYNAAGVRQVTSNIALAKLAPVGTDVTTAAISPSGMVPTPEEAAAAAQAAPTDWKTIGIAVGLGVAGVFVLRAFL